MCCVSRFTEVLFLRLPLSSLSPFPFTEVDLFAIVSVWKIGEGLQRQAGLWKPYFTPGFEFFHIIA